MKKILIISLTLLIDLSSCEETGVGDALIKRSDYVYGDGLHHTEYLKNDSVVNHNKTDLLGDFYYTSTKFENIDHILTNEKDVSFTYSSIYMAMTMENPYIDGMEYLRIELLDDTADTTYSAKFTPNGKWYSDTTIINDDENNVLTINGIENVEKNKIIGSLELSYTTTDGEFKHDYIDIFKCDVSSLSNVLSEEVDGNGSIAN